MTADLLDRLDLRVPVLSAPMGGGPSTPDLLAAVLGAGAGGFLPGAMLAPEQVREQIRHLRARTGRPFGVNLFVPGPDGVDRAALDAYARRLAPTAERLGAPLGVPHWDDDDYPAKIEVLLAERVPLVSFTFGVPPATDVARLRDAGAAVLITVTSAQEARLAYRSGADALIVQGAEAGAHRGSFVDDPARAPGDAAQPLLPLLIEIRAAVPLPLVATGGLMTGWDVAAALAAGAVAAQLGTAFLCCPEAGTTAVHRRALLDPAYPETGFTRAFTGRTARTLVNGFVREHHAAAPVGYPWVHHLTRPLRAAAAQRDDPDGVHLWAGAGWTRMRPMPAGALVALLAEELHRQPDPVAAPPG